MKTKNIVIAVVIVLVIILAALSFSHTSTTSPSTVVVQPTTTTSTTPVTSDGSPTTVSTTTTTTTATPVNDNGMTKMYKSTSPVFSINYPNTFTLDSKYNYMALGPGKNIAGVKFTIPKSMTTGTNLSEDSYLSVEYMPNDTSCTANQFLISGYPTGQHSVTENGTTYSVGSTTNAGAGNRYEETVYALPGTNPCLAIRYYIHYGAIQNYPQDGSVKEFDHTALIGQFDQIRKTLVVGK